MNEMFLSVLLIHESLPNVSLLFGSQVLPRRIWNRNGCWPKDLKALLLNDFRKWFW